MAYQALYRVWRPQTFGELIGQDAIARTLRNAIKSGQISHAYLFCGLRGTGKTSAAKIFAKAINCPNQQDGEPCNQCEICQSITAGRLVDVIEIDAASNNGVDEIRDIRDKARYAPTHAQYKVYIIDEVHMLSSGAFNALLKTLEEPPANVIFILATTEPHKIPATIISRTQRFTFNRLNQDAISDHLVKILEKEGIAYEAEAIPIISRLANGGMRDALSLLDQVLAYANDQVTADMTRQVLGAQSQERLSTYVEALIKHQNQLALETLNQSLQAGLSAKRWVEEMLYFLRDLYLDQVVTDSSQLLSQPYDASFHQLSQQIPSWQLKTFIDRLSEVEGELRFSSRPSLLLEIFTLQMSQSQAAASQLEGQSQIEQTASAQAIKQPTAPVSGPAQGNEPMQAALNPVAAKQPEYPPAANSPANCDAQSASNLASSKPSQVSSRSYQVNLPLLYRTLKAATKTDREEMAKLWPDIVKSFSNMQGALLSQTEPVAASSDVFVLRFLYTPLCQQVVADPSLIQAIEEKVQNKVGHHKRLVVITEEDWQAARSNYVQAMKAGHLDRMLEDDAAIENSDIDLTLLEATEEKPDPLIGTANQLFGGDHLTIVDD